MTENLLRRHHVVAECRRLTEAGQTHQQRRATNNKFIIIENNKEYEINQGTRQAKLVKLTPQTTVFMRSPIRRTQGGLALQKKNDSQIKQQPQQQETQFVCNSNVITKNNHRLQLRRRHRSKT